MMSAVSLTYMMMTLDFLTDAADITRHTCMVKQLIRSMQRSMEFTKYGPLSSHQSVNRIAAWPASAISSKMPEKSYIR